MQQQKSTPIHRRRQKQKEFVTIPRDAFPEELRQHYQRLAVGIDLEQGLDVGVELVPDNPRTSRLCRDLGISHSHSIAIALRYHSEMPYLQAKKLVEDGFGGRIMSPALYWCVRRWAREHDEKLASSLYLGHDWLDAVVYNNKVVVHPDRRALKQKLAEQDQFELQNRAGKTTLQAMNPALTDLLRPVESAVQYTLPERIGDGYLCQGFNESDIDPCSGLPRRVRNLDPKPLFFCKDGHLEFVGGALRTVTDYRKTGSWHTPEEAVEGLQLHPIRAQDRYCRRQQTDPFIGVRIIRSGG